MYMCVAGVYVCGRNRTREIDLSFLSKPGVVVLAQNVMRLLLYTRW